MTEPDESGHGHRKLRLAVKIAAWLLVASATATVSYALLVLSGS